MDHLEAIVEVATWSVGDAMKDYMKRILVESLEMVQSLTIGRVCMLVTTS
jgi:hypothetical protein